jgi:heme/copper-type cytochrome/quinol oxidase subunit 3
MTSRVGIDVATLPTSAFGSRDPLWWGAVGMMAIEGTVFALMMGSTLYLRGQADAWPMSLIPRDCQLVAALNVVVLLTSCVPVWFANHHAERAQLRGMRIGLWGAALLGVASLALRAWIGVHLPFRWDSNAYGSLLWMTSGLHTLHVLTGTAENLLLLALLYRGPVEEKHLVDVKVSGFYWYFVVVAWVVLYALFYLDPALLRQT